MVAITTIWMDPDIVSPNGVNGLEDIVIDEGSGEDRTVEPTVLGQGSPSNAHSNDVEEQYRTPSQTINTDTVVGSNDVSFVSVVEEPKVGMVFKKWEDLEEYYKDYAEQQGFGVSRVQGVFSKGVVRIRTAITWRCECWGRPDMRAVREAIKRAKEMGVSGSGGVVGGRVCEDELNRSKRKSKKCECCAMLYGSINYEKEWVVRKVILEHSGHTPHPSHSKLVKEYRMKHFTSSVRRKLFNLYEGGVPVSQIHDCMAVERNGLGNMPLTVKDLQHEVYKARRVKMFGGDCAAMMSYFQHMKATTDNFYHSQRVDEEGRLKDVFWVDGRSRIAYEEFGDVVCFDATYLTNEYDLPFLNFVGVNHHGQSLLLGCALVSHEDCDTFNWIFNQWLCSMNNQAPVAILTDQAAAMRKPLEEVMPNTRHRWCIWHIMRKIPEKLGKCKRYKEFKSVFKRIVYESFSILEFENRWCSFIEEYKLEKNAWLGDLYRERHMWVPAFMKDFFWAGMKTTQRVESINSFFDGFVNRKTKLFEFPLKYSKALHKRATDESDADANCSKYLRRLVTGFAVEKLFQNLYTDTKFQEVQTECARMMYCICVEERFIENNIVLYMLEDRVWVVPEGLSEERLTNRRRFYSATFNTITKEVLCDCRKFQTDGIMCKHMIRILDQNHVVDIPQKYILDRWRKDIVRKHTLVKVEIHDPSQTTSVKRYNRLLTAFETLCDEVVLVSDETVDCLVNKINNMRAEIVGQKCNNHQHSQEASYHDDGGATNASGVATTVSRAAVDPCLGVNQDQCFSPSLGVHQDVHSVPTDPPRTRRPRGRPKGSRNKSTIESMYQSASYQADGGATNVSGAGEHPTGVPPEEYNGPTDPPIIKRPRGRPKGSRNKSTLENGYKKPQQKKAKAQHTQGACSTSDGVSKIPVSRNPNVTMREEVIDEMGTDQHFSAAGYGDDFLNRNTLSWIDDSSQSF